jgi:NADPH-dependent curcumin reductase CurA
MARQTRFVTFDAYVPTGDLKPSDFVVREATLPELGEGEVLLRPVAFSLDPVNRLPISGKAPPRMAPNPPGEPMRGAAVCRVIESRNGDHPVGMLVTGWVPWSDWVIWPFLDDWMGLAPFDAGLGKPSLALGIYGITGVTAYFGIVKVGEVQAGQTVLVSSAAGSVGSVAGQIAKILGARVVGLTSAREKRDVLIGQLGFDAAIDYRAADFAEQLAALIPSGPDIYFDNVGGRTSTIVMNQMRRPARIVECGQISTYGDGDGAWKVDITPHPRQRSAFRRLQSGAVHG